MKKDKKNIEFKDLYFTNCYLGEKFFKENNIIIPIVNLGLIGPNGIKYIDYSYLIFKEIKRETLIVSPYKGNGEFDKPIKEDKVYDIDSDRYKKFEFEGSNYKKGDWIDYSIFSEKFNLRFINGYKIYEKGWTPFGNSPTLQVDEFNSFMVNFPT